MVKPTMIRQTSPDTVHGKSAKYRQGDCVSILCGDGKFLGALISGKFNAYYDLTLLEFCDTEKPTLSDFVNGRLFGTRIGSFEQLIYGTDRQVLKCMYADKSLHVEKVGTVQLVPSLEKSGYSYVNDIDDLQTYYLEELPVRIEKSEDAKKFPAISFYGRHLINARDIIKEFNAL